MPQTSGLFFLKRPLSFAFVRLRISSIEVPRSPVQGRYMLTRRSQLLIGFTLPGSGGPVRGPDSAPRLNVAAVFKAVKKKKILWRW